MSSKSSRASIYRTRNQTRFEINKSSFNNTKLLLNTETSAILSLSCFELKSAHSISKHIKSTKADGILSILPQYYVFTMTTKIRRKRQLAKKKQKIAISINIF